MMPEIRNQRRRKPWKKQCSLNLRAYANCSVEEKGKDEEDLKAYNLDTYDDDEADNSEKEGAGTTTTRP